MNMQNNTQHTPGPWFACSGNARQKYNIECKGTHNECWPIATLRGPDREANARLLAAAPELLESLQAVVDYLETFACHNEDGRIALKQAQETIAKAKVEVR